MSTRYIKKEIIEIDSESDSDSEYDDPDEIVITRENTDSVVYSIIEQFKQRSDFGLEKYGTNLDRTDLKPIDWIQHAQEEHMDAILYLEKLKNVIGNMEIDLRSAYSHDKSNNEIIKFLLFIIFILFYNLFITQQYNH